jgi:ferredoxin
MSVVVRIDPTRCRGHAICALLYSEGVQLDRWGYGRVVVATPDGRRLVKRARRAAAACPNGAVVVEERLEHLDSPSDGDSIGV